MIAVLPGDGIGAEVMREGVRVLTAIAPELEIEEGVLGADGLRLHGKALPDETLELCRRSEAVLMGAVGSDDYSSAVATAEQGMFGLRQHLDVYANLRPFVGPDVDMLIVRELVSGIYFGARGSRADGVVYDTCEYDRGQVERLVRRGFEQARNRRLHLTSVDKANVLATSRLWREVVDTVAVEYPDVEVDHMLVDTAAMRLVNDAPSFDVIVTDNMFGDILSDVAAAVTGGLGAAASASLSDDGPGLFEPVHGTAPDIAGRGLANPTGMLRSVALMLRHGLARPADAAALEAAIERAIVEAPTVDRGGSVGTTAFGDAVLDALAEPFRGAAADADGRPRAANEPSCQTALDVANEERKGPN